MQEKKKKTLQNQKKNKDQKEEMLMLNYNEIGKKIRKERIKRNLTQDDLAEILFVTRQAISKWETGKSLPDQDVMLQLSNLFSISINDILNAKE